MSTSVGSDLLSATYTANIARTQSPAGTIGSGTKFLGPKANFMATGRINEAGTSSFFTLKERLTSIANSISEAGGRMMGIPSGWEQAAPLIKIVTAAAAIGGLAWWRYRLRTTDPRARQARDFVRAQRPKDWDEQDWRRKTDLMGLQLDKVGRQNADLTAQLIAVQEELRLVKGRDDGIQTASPNNKTRNEGSVSEAIATIAEPRCKHIHDRPRHEAGTTSVRHSDVNRGENTHAANLTASHGSNAVIYPSLTLLSTTPEPELKMRTPYADKTRPDRNCSPIKFGDSPSLSTPMMQNKFQKDLVMIVLKRMDQTSAKMVSGQITPEEFQRDIREQMDLYQYPDTNGLSPSRLSMQQANSDLITTTGSDGTKRKADVTELRAEEFGTEPKKQKTDFKEKMAVSKSGRYQLRPTHARKASLGRNDLTKPKALEKIKSRQNGEADHPVILESKGAAYAWEAPRNIQSFSRISEIYIYPPLSGPRTPQHSTAEITTPEAQMMDVSWRHKNGVRTEEVTTPLITMDDRDED